MSRAEFDFELELIARREAELRRQIEEVRGGQGAAAPKGQPLQERLERLVRLEGEPGRLVPLLAALVERAVVHPGGRVDLHVTFAPEELAGERRRRPPGSPATRR